MNERRLLLLSNSRDAAGHFLKHPQREIQQFLGSRRRTVLFVPYAAVTTTLNAYAERTRGAFAEMGYEVVSIHDARDPVQVLEEVDAVAVGGGNTYHLLSNLQRRNLVDPIREHVLAGLPYIGWSAGAVLACPTIQTTNDMPIVTPRHMSALSLVSFQINAHYTDFHPPGFQGETRAERLNEFVEVNPGVTVVGLPEGTMLRVEGDEVVLVGAVAAPVFRRGRPVVYAEPGSRVEI